MPTREEILGYLDEALTRYPNVPRDVAHRMANLESGLNPLARSDKNAMGVMQLVPGTAREMGVRDPWDYRQSIDGGLKYLSQNIERFGGDVSKGVAAYHAGPGAVERAGGIPNTHDGIMPTSEYVRRLTGGGAAPAGARALTVGGPPAAKRRYQAGDVIEEPLLTVPSSTGGMADPASAPEPSTWDDIKNRLKYGWNQTGESMREGVRQALGDDVVQSIENFGGALGMRNIDTTREQLDAELSPAMRESMAKDWWDEEKGTFGPAWGDWRSYVGPFSQSIPETALTMLPAFRIAKTAEILKKGAVMRAAMARGATKEAAEKVAEEAGAKALARTAMIAGGALEGVSQAGGSAAQVRDEIMRIPDAALDQSEAFKGLVQQFDGDRAAAKKQLADDAATQAYIAAGVVTGIFGGQGDRVIAKLLRGQITGGIAKRAATGAVAEGLFEEAPQSAGSAIAENLAAQQADPSIPTARGAINQAMGGGVVGGLMGAGMGAAFGGRGEPGKRRLPPQAGGAPAVNPPSVKDDPFVSGSAIEGSDSGPPPGMPPGATQADIDRLHRSGQGDINAMRDWSDGRPTTGETDETDNEAPPEPVEPSEAEVKRRLEQAARMQDGDVGRPSDNAPFKAKQAALMARGKQKRNDTHEVVELGPDAWVLRPRTVEDQEPAAQDAGAADVSRETPAGEAPTLQKTESVNQTSLQSGESVNQAVEGETRDSGDGVERYVWMRNKEGGQKVGNAMVVRPLTAELFYRHFKGTVDLEDFDAYRAKYPKVTHVQLVTVGDNPEKLMRVGSLDQVRPGSEAVTKGWVKRVDSFDSEEAKSHRAIADSEVEAAREGEFQAANEGSPFERGVVTASDTSKGVNPRIPPAGLERAEQVEWYRGYDSIMDRNAPPRDPNEGPAIAVDIGKAPGAGEAIKKYGLPDHTVFKRGLGLAKDKWAAEADGESGNYRLTADEAAKDLRSQLDAVKSGKERAAAVDRASTSAAEKIKRGEQPTPAEWKQILGDYKEGHRYARQPSISEFLTKYLGVPKHNIKGNIGEAAGVLTSDVGATSPIVYLDRLAGVFGKSAIDAAAHEAATSPKNDLPQPTEAQKEAGNYQKGHLSFQGLDISIENPKGSVRSGTDKSGKKWSVTMKQHYGYIKGTVGRDKDHIDAFIGGQVESPKVFVVDQVNEKGEFDEHKVMLGFDSLPQAKAAYLSNYAKGWKGLGSITETTMDDFKAWLAAGKTKSEFGKREVAQREEPTVGDKLRMIETLSTKELYRVVKALGQPAYKVDGNTSETAARGLHVASIGSFTRARIEEVLGRPLPEEAPKAGDEAEALPDADPTIGATDAEVAKIADEFEGAVESAQGDDEQVHHLFDPPKKNEVVRLADKVKVYNAKHGWMTPAEAKAKIAEWEARAVAQGKTSANSERVVLSFFDKTGAWSLPWEQAGYDVWRFDIQNDPEQGDVNNFSTEFFNDWFGSFEGKDIYAILAACPCTDFAVSGARHFAAKDKDGRTVSSVKLVHQTLAAIEYFKPAVWAIENPVGRIEKLTGLPPWRLSFDPNHLGDPYTKKTLLWGRFNGDLPIAPVEPTEGSKMHQKYGGKGQATKNARSVTPEGFAYGFFMANNAIDHPIMAIANKYDRLDRDAIKAAVDVGINEETIDHLVEDYYYQDLDDAAANKALRDAVKQVERAFATKRKAVIAEEKPETKVDRRAIHEIPLGEWKRIGKAAFVHQKGKRRPQLLWNDVIVPIKDQRNGKLTKPMDDVLADIHREAVEAQLRLERSDRSDASNPVLGAGLKERAQARLDKGKYVSPEVMADYQDLAAKPAVTPPAVEAAHVDAGKIEAVTPEVIREAIKESARDTTMDLRQARDAVLKKVDAALAKAKEIVDVTNVIRSTDRNGNTSYEVKDPTEKFPDATRHAEREDLEKEIGYLTFKVEGDGRFKVLNTKESLKAFRDKLAHAGGFVPEKKSRPHKGLAGLPSWQKAMTPAVLEELWEDREYLTAYEGAKAGGKPFMFGATDDAVPSVYHSAASTEVAGYKAFVGKRLGRKKEEPWSVIEIDTGLAFGRGANAADAVSKAKERAAKVGKEKVDSTVAKSKKISQEELERKFVSWATEQDQKLAEKSRMEDERERKVADRDAEQSKDGNYDEVHLSTIKEKIEEGGGSASIRGVGVQIEAVQRLIDNGKLVDVGSGYVGLPSSEQAAEEVSEPAKPEPKPVDVPEGYKKVTEYFKDNKTVLGYAEFSVGEQVRNKETRAIGEVESYVGEGPIFSTYLVKFPMGNQKLTRQYLEAVVPEAAPAEKASKPPRRESKKDKAEDGALVARRKEFYTPGNVIRNDYGRDHDRVLEYRDNDPRDVGAWGVRVEKVEQRDGEWVSTERPRWHSTEPDKKDSVVAKAPPEVEKRAAAKAPTESKASASIVDDVGENLKANRRNFKAGLTWDEIRAENAALKRVSVVKARVWARPDYEAMVGGGMNPLVARIVKQVYDGIAKSPPRADDASLEGYIAAVNRVRDGLLAWTEDSAALATFGQEVARAVEARKKGPFSRTPLDSRALIERIWKDTPKGMAFRESDAAKDMRLIGGNRFLAAVQIDIDGLLKATSDIIDGWPASKQAWQKQGYAVLKPGEYVVEQDVQYSRWNPEEKRDVPVEGVWRWTIKSKTPQGGRSNWVAYGPTDPSEGGAKSLLVNDRSYTGFHGAFDTEQAALDGAQEIIAKQRKASGQDIRGTNVSGSERTGPDRRGKDEDISADRLMQTFGFRGVNFGRKGYIGEAERQAYVNAAYDGFHDLAEVLGVPPKALSLGGMLGIAFGAQGRGGHAAAHFVPGVNEINLTKGAGAGTLAHEWGHALDHYFARQAGLEAQDNPFLSHHLRTGAGIRPELVTQFKAIVEAMNKRAATPEEAEKRTIDSINIARQNLESWLKAIRGNTNPKESAATRFDELADRIRKGDIGTGSFGPLGLPQTIAELREVTKQARGRHEIASNMKGLMASAHHLKYVVENKDRAAAHVPQVATNYARESSAADKGKGGKEYWRTAWEMFARAFESFVADKITAAGNINTFLSDAQQRAAATDLVVDRDGTERRVPAFPYPRGVDREAVNKAFADLVSEVKVRDEGDMPVMFDRLPEGWGETGADTDQALPGGEPGVVLRDETSEADGKALREAVEGVIQRGDPRARVPAGAIEIVALPHAGLLQRIAAAFGKRVVGFRINDPKLRFFGGATKVTGRDGAIFILADNPRPHLSILGHELLHQLRSENPELYARFRRAIQPYLTSHWRKHSFGAKAWSRHDEDKAMEELLADIVGDGFMRRDFWQQLGKSNPSLLQKIYNAVLVIMDKVWKALGGTVNPRSREYLMDFQAAVRIAADVMAEYGKQTEASKAAGDLSFAAKGGPLWRSALAEAMQKAPWSKAGDMEAAQFSRWLEARAKDGTFKPDELEWSGLKDWVAMQGPRVTRAGAVEYLAQNGVRVEETMLGSNPDGTDPVDEAVVRLTATGWQPDIDPVDGVLLSIRNRNGDEYLAADGGNGIVWLDERENHIPDGTIPENVIALANDLGRLLEDRYAHHLDGDSRGDGTRYFKWQLPGGEGYRELLLTLPTKSDFDPAKVEIRRHLVSTTQGATSVWYDGTKIMQYGDDPVLQPGGGYKQRSDAYWMKAARALYEKGDRVNKVKSQGSLFYSSHFAQPNILAHVRFNERTDAEGKRVLFLEEIQSDWAQKGRSEGFRGKETKHATRDELRRQLREELDTNGRTGDARAIEAELRTWETETGAIPSAPFVTKTEAWVALALKRMIRYAADNGFDAVAWTNGEQQADRYSLRKQVDKIEWNPVIGSTDTDVLILTAQGRVQLVVSKDGVVTGAPNHAGQPFVDKKLAEVVGKAASEKIMGSYKGLLEGDGLNIGGEGMTTFYDRIVPNIANDLLKKMGGGKVETVGVDRTDFGERGRPKDWNAGDGVSSEQPGFYLTDQMRALADDGMPMFAGLPLERDRSVIETANRRIGKFVDEFLAGRMKDGYTQIIGPTPTALQAVGAPALDMQIDGALVRKVLDGKHAAGMSPDLFKGMAEGLYNPLAVFDSPDENGKPGMLALTEAVDRKGEPVIIAVHMERSPHRVKINDVASMYGLERAEKRLAKMKLLYVRNDKGPAPSTTPAGPYMAGMVQAARGRGEIVLTERDVVNRFGPSFDRLDDGPATSLPGLGAVTRQRIGDHIRAAFDSSRTFNPWHRTVGTQFHKAQVDSDFRPVFDEAQRFLFDTSQFTMDAADHAPGLLPRLERLWDAVKHVRENLSPFYRKDVEAVSKAIFEGTLANRREPPAGLSERQRTLFDQARAAIDASLDSLSVSVAANQLMILNRSSRKGGRGNAVPPAMIEAMKRRPGEAEGAFNSALRDAERMAAEDYQKAIDASAVARGTPQAERASAEANAAELWLQTVRKAQKDVGLVFGKADKLKAEGYAPLMRFGRYTVTMRNSDGGVEWFSMHESEADAKGRARELAEEFPGNRIESAVMSQERWKLFRGVSPETLSIFADEAGLLDDAAMQKYLQIAVSNRSALKRLIHRKGRAGYDEDIQRVLAAFILSNARMASRNYHFGKMTEAASSIPESKGDVADEATKLVEFVQNPEEEAGALRGLLFVNYLGGSVASALVNMTQPITMTLPYLAQFGGVGKAGAALSAGARIAAGASRPDADLAAAIKRATDDGLIAPHEIHQLQAEAIRNFGANPLVRSGMMVWGSLFSMAEQFNRRVTFAAAFDIARGMGLKELRERGFSSPFQFAEQAVEDTQGIYNRGNRPNWARGAVGATVFTFKQFSIAYLEFLKRLPLKERTLALAIMVLAAGLQGLPFADDLEDLIDTIGQSLGYRTNSKRALRELAVRTLGEPFGKFLTTGASAIPGVPLDVQGRLGMGNLIPGTGALKRSETNRGDDALEVIGPVGGLIKSAGGAIQSALRGDVVGGLAGLAPVAAQNAMKAVDMWQTGQYRDRGGRKVVDVSGGDAAIKALGFQPNRVAKVQRTAREVQQDIALVRQVENEITAQWAQGRAENDQAKIDEARAKLRDWNEKNPDFPIRVQASQITRRVNDMRSERAGRLIKSAPREVRKAVEEELEE